MSLCHQLPTCIRAWQIEIDCIGQERKISTAVCELQACDGPPHKMRVLHQNEYIREPHARDLLRNSKAGGYPSRVTLKSKVATWKLKGGVSSNKRLPCKWSRKSQHKWSHRSPLKLSQRNTFSLLEEGSPYFLVPFVGHIFVPVPTSHANSLEGAAETISSINSSG